jgi:hypothetical protein
VPQVVWANAGTPLLWFTAFYLYIANLSLGIIEGIILAAIGKNKYIKSILLAIVANFVSFIAGHYILTGFQDVFLSVFFDLKWIYTFWIVSLSLLYFFTVYIEAFFFSLAYPKTERSYKKTLKLSYFINLVSYAGMIIGFFTFSRFSFFTELEVNQSILDKKFDFELYVYHNDEILIDTLSNEFEGVTFRNIYRGNSNFSLKLVEDTSLNKLDLILEENRQDTNLKSIIVQKDFLPIKYKSKYLNQSYHKLHESLDFRDSNKIWNINYSMAWAADGFSIIYSDKEKESENYALEVPWMFWKPSDFTILNDDEVLFLIGGRLVLMNIETKEIAYITRADSYAVRKIKSTN